ncbi:MAG: CPBP family intramembrane metalloprotease [Anaerofustis stercorihominis]|nr:CPBP family intramembrane metalloprotease [Anaerofustis stercorihominis]
MKKLFDKDEVMFAVGWIIVYVITFANADMISESIGIPKLVTVFAGAVLTAVLILFIRKHSLSEYLGVCRVKTDKRHFLYFIPLIIISSVNLWGGVSFTQPYVYTLLYIISMVFVGFLEEVIFRGLLFKGMCRTDIKSAVIVSSVSFGMGHIVNLLLGAPLFDTLLQLVYASAIGFCYTAVFLLGGSIVPCIISHIFVNATSIFAAETSAGADITITVVQTVISTIYGLYLLNEYKKHAKINENGENI